MPRSPLCLLLLPLAVACGDTDADDSGGDDTGDQDTGDTDTDTDSGGERRVTETGDCHPEADLDAAEALPFETVGMVGQNFDAYNQLPAIIADDAGLAAFETSIGTSIDTEIDFETQVLLFSTVSSGSTCGTDDPVVHVVSMDGAPHLSLELTNPGALCDNVCDMASVASQLVVVDKAEGMDATVCGRLVETCEG
jgi:hypothetical protein